MIMPGSQFWIEHIIYWVQLIIFWSNQMINWGHQSITWLKENLSFSIGTFFLFEQSILWYFSLINIIYTFFLIIAFYNILVRAKEVREEDTSHILKSESLPPILFIIPMHNESNNALRNISNILGLTYRYKKVIIVNDGSDDNTLEILQNAFEFIEIPKYFTEELPTQKIKAVYQSKRHPELILLDKEAGGKFDAVNAAINAAPTPFFVVLDADTFIDSVQFESLVRPIITSPETIGIGASIRIMNDCDLEYNRISTTRFPQNFLPAVQSLEYLRAFSLRDGLDVVNGNFIIAGAFSIYPRDLAIQVGGFAPTCGEDCEIVVRLHRIMKAAQKKYRLRYFPDPVAYTLAPTTLKELGNQRIRWHLAIMETIWFHKRTLFNPRYGQFGLFGVPFWLFGETLEPIVELSGWTYVITTFFLGTLHTRFFLLLVAVSLGYTFLYTIFALAIEEFSFRKFPTLRSLTMLIIANFLENFGYRQLTLFWRLYAFYKFITQFKVMLKTSKFIQGLVKRALQILQNN